MKKADNFNPGKWLVENKITTQSRLNEAKDPDSVVSQEARDMFYNAVAKVMKDLYQADIMDNDIIDDYLGTEGGLLGDAIEAFLHPEDLDESRLNENWLPYKDMSDEEYYESFKKFVISTLKQYKVIDEHIKIYLDEVLKKGNIKEYEGISDKDLYEDFLEVKNDQIEQDEDLFDFDF